MPIKPILNRVADIFILRTYLSKDLVRETDDEGFTRLAIRIERSIKTNSPVDIFLIRTYIRASQCQGEREKKVKFFNLSI